MNMHALKGSVPPFTRAVTPVMHALAQPQVLPSQVNYAIESVRNKWLDAMLDDALLLMLQIGQKNAMHLRRANASLQFGLVCAIYGGLREGMQEHDCMKEQMLLCMKYSKEHDGHISATLAMSSATALEIARVYVRKASSKAIYQTCQAIDKARNASCF